VPAALSAERLLTRDEARHFAASVAKLPDLWRMQQKEAPSRMPLGAAELSPQLRLLGWAAGRWGDGVPLS